MERETNLSELSISPAPDPADLPNGVQKSILKHWISIRGTTDVPDQSWIDALSYPAKSLPFITIIEVEAETLKYKTRLSGSAVCDAFGVNMTGKYIVDSTKNPGIMQRLDWCVSNRSHYLTTGSYTRGQLQSRSYNALSLPYKNARGEISRILSAYSFN